MHDDVSVNECASVMSSTVYLRLLQVSEQWSSVPVLTSCHAPHRQ